MHWKSIYNWQFGLFFDNIGVAFNKPNPFGIHIFAFEKISPLLLTLLFDYILFDYINRYHLSILAFSNGFQKDSIKIIFRLCKT